MHHYTPFPGELTLLPPGHFRDTRFFYFFLRADQARLQACCDRYFNDRLAAAGSPLGYKSLGCVMLAFTHVEELKSADPAAGTTRYKDIAFWVPVIARHTGGLPRLCLFPPAIFVDEAATMVTGREMFGLPKQLGRFQMPLTPDELSRLPAPQFRLEVMGTLQDGGPRDWRTFATIAARPGAASPSLLDRAAAALSELTAIFELPSVFDSFSLPEALATSRSLGLKQFRDAASPRESCYTAIVEAPLRMKQLVDQPHFFRDAFDLDLESEPVPSHPICRELGLEPGRHRVPAAIYFRAHMEMDAAQVVWRDLP
jgi:hypothetical protein